MVDRTMPALLRNLRNRVTSLERRIARGTFQLPGRLSPTGAEVTDWDNAVNAGFYWGVNAAHQPTFGTATHWVGQVEVFNDDASTVKIVQTLMRPDVSTGPSFKRYWRSDTSAWSAWGYEDATAGLPLPISDYGNDNFSFTFTAASWGVIAGSSEITFGALPAPMMVDLRYNAQAGTTTAAAYAMLGVACIGGLTLNPDVNQVTGVQDFRDTPFANTPDSGTAIQLPVVGLKRVIVPAGSPTTRFRLWARRNTANGTQRMNYSRVEAIPVRWM